MIKIALVEDNEVVRDGLIKILSTQKDMEVVAVAVNGFEAVLLFEGNLEVDIVLSDLKMPLMNGIEMTEQLMAVDPTLKVVILTMQSKRAYAKRALQVGVRGFLSKYGEIGELFQGIRSVHAGKTFVSKYDQ